MNDAMQTVDLSLRTLFCTISTSNIWTAERWCPSFRQRRQRADLTMQHKRKSSIKGMPSLPSQIGDAVQPVLLDVLHMFVCFS